MNRALALVTIGVCGLLVMPESARAAQQQITSSTGLSASVSTDGSYQVTATDFGWTFSGNLGQPVNGITFSQGADSVGTWTELDFTYANRVSSIRLYNSRPAALFSTTYLVQSPNGAAFPHFSSYPQGLSTFSLAPGWDNEFGRLHAHSPWLSYDARANAYLFSPATNFITGTNQIAGDNAMEAAIDSQILSLPAGFTHRSVLAFGHGIAGAYSAWGQTLTGLSGKQRAGSDSATLLNKLSYWTDAGAAYYYSPTDPTQYIPTLLSLQPAFNKAGVSIGSLELDSWYYPKGTPSWWGNTSGGLNTYVADSSLFPQGLPAFQQTLGIPLVSHARWIDVNSPIRSQYQMSGNVSIDPKFWRDYASYLSSANVEVFEQDWLFNNAQTTLNLTDPDAFLDNMAAGMASTGRKVMYCMPLWGDIMQSSKYNNVVSARTSPDYLNRTRWDQFLLNSPIASAVGLWPFTDACSSANARDLLLSTLSAGPVASGDSLAAINAANLQMAVRADGVIVKPDAPIAPLDATYLAISQNSAAPMVASTYTDQSGLRTAYVLAYSRASGTTLPIGFTPDSAGVATPAYVYDVFNARGSLVQSGSQFTDTVDYNGNYYVVAPIGKSGIAFLGDAGKFVANGKKRIESLVDDGKVRVAVRFAASETVVTLRVYAPQRPFVTAAAGSIQSTSSDGSNLYRVSVAPPIDGSGLAQIVFDPNPAIQINPPSWDFGAQSAGMPTAPQTFAIQNASTIALSLNSIGVVSGQVFRIASNSCPSTLQPGSSCAVAVIYAPTQPGIRSTDSIQINYGSPAVIQTVALSGNTAQPASLIATAGTPQTAAINAAFPTALQATVKDSSGNPVGGVTVVFAAPATGASGTFGASVTASAVTDATGKATAPLFSANSVAGPYNVTASVTGVASVASFGLSNSADPNLINLAIGKTATQSSTLAGFGPSSVASSAVDGNTDGNFFHSSVSHTNSEANAWWQVDLGSTSNINSIAIWNRTDCCQSRLTDYWVFVSNTPFASTDTPATLQARAGTWNTHQSGYPNPATTIVVNTPGRYVRVQLNGTNYLNLAEVQVFGQAYGISGQVLLSGSPLSGVSMALSGSQTGSTTTTANGNYTIGGLLAGTYTVTPSLAGYSFTPSSLTFTSIAASQTANFVANAIPRNNLALGKAATQSSTLAGFGPSSVASSAVDGNTDGNFFHGSVSHTNPDPNAWWQVDLGVTASINSIAIWNRTDCCSDRLNDYWVFVSNTPFAATDTPATLQGRAGVWSSHQTSWPNPSTTIAASVSGRYVRVQLSGANYLHLAEVQVFGVAQVTNLALQKQATQSSTLGGFGPTSVASSAVDGNTDGNFFDGSVSHTNFEPNAWWQVDLGAQATVNSIAIWNRTDCCGDRLNDYWIFVSNTPFAPSDTPASLLPRAGTWAIHQTSSPNPSSTIPVGVSGRYIRIQLNGTNYLNLAEVQVFGQ